jgi:hypothetical protein
MVAIDVRKIAERRVKIEDEIARLGEHVLQLRSELADLDIADRVINRLIDEGVGTTFKTSGRSLKRAGKDKPTKLPTLREMIINVLHKAKREGRSNLEPKAIATLIAENYSSEIKRDSITAVAWTMWKRAQLSKSGSAYTLPAQDQPSN